MQIPSYNHLVSFLKFIHKSFSFPGILLFLKISCKYLLTYTSYMLLDSTDDADIWECCSKVLKFDQRSKMFFWNLQCLFLLSVENLNSHILHVSDFKFSALDRSMNLTTCFFIILSDCIKRVHLKKIILIISINNTFFHFNFSFFQNLLNKILNEIAYLRADLSKNGKWKWQCVCIYL